LHKRRGYSGAWLLEFTNIPIWRRYREQKQRIMIHELKPRPNESEREQSTQPFAKLVPTAEPMMMEIIFKSYF